jgi:hypothetical protein
VVNISGGDVGRAFHAQSGSEVNLFVTEFFLDGVEQDLTAGIPLLINTSNDFHLQAKLLDGSWLVFDFDRVSNPQPGVDEFDLGSRLTVTLVPEPNSLALALTAGLFLLRRRSF